MLNAKILKIVQYFVLFFTSCEFNDFLEFLRRSKLNIIRRSLSILKFMRKSSYYDFRFAAMTINSWKKLTMFMKNIAWMTIFILTVIILIFSSQIPQKRASLTLFNPFYTLILTGGKYWRIHLQLFSQMY